MKDWCWKIGFLRGYGEAIWQELAGNIRRVTRLISLPDGRLLFQKALIGVASKSDVEPQFAQEILVLVSREPNDDLALEATRAWEGGQIIPANGVPRFKVQ